MGLGTYLVLYLTEEKGLTLVQAGAITGATSLVGFFINPLCGVLSDAIHSRKWVTIPSAFLYAFSMLGFTMFNSMGALIAMMFIKDSTFLSATRPLNVMVAESTPAEYMASTSGIYMLFPSSEVPSPRLFSAQCSLKQALIHQCFTQLQHSLRWPVLCSCL